MIRLIKRLLISAILGSLFYMAAAKAQDDALKVIQVRLLPQAEVQGSDFTLGEVAELDGFDLDAVKKVAGIAMGRSPRPGSRTRLSEVQVRSRIFQVMPPETIHLQFPKSVWVSRAAQVVSGEEIGRMVRERAAGSAGEESAGLRLTIAGAVRDAVLPVGRVSWDIQPVGRHLVTGGTRTYRVTAKVDNKDAWRAMVRVKMEVIREIVVAAKPIRRNQVIGKDDIRMESNDVSAQKSERFMTRLEDVVGRRAKRPIGTGEWIHTGMAEAVADVKEGGRVILEYRTERLYFRTPGVALVAGRSGDFIPVRNLQSGRIVYGVIQNEHMVKVN